MNFLINKTSKYLITKIDKVKILNSNKKNY